MPFDNGAVIGGYRIDILEKAGLKADDFKDITWSKFLELGKQVKEKTNTPMLTVTAGTNDLKCLIPSSLRSLLLSSFLCPTLLLPNIF